MTRTEDQTARSFIQRQFEPQGAKHGPQYQIAIGVASVKRCVSPAQRSN